MRQLFKNNCLVSSPLQNGSRGINWFVNVQACYHPRLVSSAKGNSLPSHVCVRSPTWFKVTVEPNWELFLNLSDLFQVGAWKALEIMMGSEWVFYKHRPFSSRHSKCSCCWNVRTAQIISTLAMTGVRKVALFIRWWCSSSLVNKYRSACWTNHLPDVSCR